VARETRNNQIPRLSGSGRRNPARFLAFVIGLFLMQAYPGIKMGKAAQNKTPTGDRWSAFFQRHRLTGNLKGVK
jgi:hypothetical protein